MELPSEPRLSSERAEAMLNNRAAFMQKAAEVAAGFSVETNYVIELFARSIDVDLTNYGTDELVDKLCNDQYISDVRWREIINLLEAQAQERGAAVDALTNLDNRGSLDRHLERMAKVIKHSRFEGGSKTFSLILLDLDNFKSINDNFGHPVGDAVLQAVAGVLKKHIRGSDLAARYGGEELAVVVDGGLAAAAALAERIRSSIASLDVEKLGIDPVQREQVTASIGVAEYESGDVSASAITALLSEVDKALYTAKQSGKNRVEVSL